MNSFNITALESALSDIIKKAGVTTTVYNNRPKAAPTKNDFAIVRVSGDVLDYGTYGSCAMEVSLFAKDVENLKNGKKLGIMYEKFIAGLPQETVWKDGNKVVGDYLLDSHPSIVADAPDDYGYNARVLNLSVIIKSI